MTASEASHRIRTLLASAGRAVSRPRAYPRSETLRLAFAGLWNEPWGTYSTVFAQAPALSATYRRNFLLEAAKMVNPSIAAELMAEAQSPILLQGKELRSPVGRINLFYRSPRFLIVGFENEQPPELQRKRLLRNDEYLRVRNPYPLLAFFSEGGGALAAIEAQYPRQFVPAVDQRLSGWADGCLIDWLHLQASQLEEVLKIVSTYLRPSQAA